MARLHFTFLTVRHFLQASETKVQARRPYPRAKAALKSVQDACATCPGVEPLAAALVVALNVYFSRCADVVYADGLEQLSRLLPHPAWEEDNSLMGHELTPKQRKEVSAARLGRALWRMARLELADMVPEEMQLAELYLDALCGGELQPPAPDPPAEALQAYHQLMARLSAGFDSQQDLWRLRTRCGLAPLMAPRPEGPNSFGRVNWDCITNGTDEPTPRDGWFSLFARLPARERADDNERVLQRVLHALAPLNAEMGLKCTKHVPQVLPRGLLMPSLSQNNDYTHAGLDAAGRQLLRLRVSNRWIPAPCATQPQRFGNLVELTWRAPEKRNLERHLRKALQAEFAPDAVSCRQLEELTGWGCSVVPHTRSRIPVDGSEYELEAVSGEAPERAGEDSKRELSTLWSLWRGKEQVAKAVMTYRNVDVTIFGACTVRRTRLHLIARLRPQALASSSLLSKRSTARRASAGSSTAPSRQRLRGRKLAGCPATPALDYKPYSSQTTTAGSRRWAICGRKKRRRCSRGKASPPPRCSRPSSRGAQRTWLRP